MKNRIPPVAEETTTHSNNATPLSKIDGLTDAFTGVDYTNINFEELCKDQSGIKIITILYSQNESELKQARKTICDLTASIKFFKAFPISNISFAIMNLVGTFLVGLGAPSNLWLILPGAILVLTGNIMPFIIINKGEKF